MWRDKGLQTGDVIALQADTGLYLSRIARGDTNPIEAEKNSIDPYSQFTVTLIQSSRTLG